ncbi:hypothetical protein EON64_01315 [archaeon]|nr:MAG: hypothetical protein EON64_01315 [archaeon]
MQEQKQKEDMDAELAHRKEHGDLLQRHQEKSAQDKQAIREKREELASFQDLEQQERPSADRLERFARLEIFRCEELLKSAMAAMKRLQKEFEDIQTEYEAQRAAQEQQQGVARNSSSSSSNNNKKLQELRSMANIAETRLKEAAREVSQSLEDLLDASCLLAKAVREREQQQLLLPLFDLCIFTRSVRVEGNGSGASDRDTGGGEGGGGDVHACDYALLVVAAVTLCKGTFDEKFHLLLRLFTRDTQLLDAQCVLALGACMAKVFQKLKLLPPTTSSEEIEQQLVRIYTSLGVNTRTDALTVFEAKQLCRLTLSRSEMLMRLFRITAQSHVPHVYTQYSTYQLNAMHPIVAYTRGLLDLPSALDRTHYGALQARPRLGGPEKRAVHDLAMAMGQGDPLAADYSGFFTKTETKSSYRIQPMNNGLLANLTYYEHNQREAAAVKIQSIARCYLDKKLAERATRQLALLEAKDTAVKELKARILREYQKREQARGVGKMKWDAEVRMRQAKLRAQGQAVSRSDVVMLMVEEAIDVANQTIDVKFEELKLEQDMKTLKMVQPKDTSYRITFSPALFDMHDETIVPIRILELSAPSSSGDAPTDVASSIVGEGSVKTEEWVGEGDSIKGTGESLKEGSFKVGGESLKWGEGGEGFDTNTIIPTMSEEELDRQTQRALQLVRGEQVIPLLKNTSTGASALNIKGETLFESQLRRLLSGAEVTNMKYLFNRLRLLDKHISEFKAREILGEVPSKRLLLRYIHHNDLAFVSHDLAKHYKFKCPTHPIAHFLRQLEKTDFEYGVLRRHMAYTQQLVETGLLDLYSGALQRAVRQLKDALELRQESSSDQRSLLHYAQEELNRLLTTHNSNHAQYSSALVGLANEREKLLKLAWSKDFIQEKLLVVKELAGMRQMTVLVVPACTRYDWTKRYYDALKACKTNPSKLPLLRELSSLVSDFVQVVSADAITIISELHLPEHMRTVPVHSVKKVSGRGDEMGRGIRGSRCCYFAHNVFYTVALDYDGVFNGSDEFAAKAFSQERLVAVEYMQANVDRLHTPLVTTVDYYGYRVMAVAKLPIQLVVCDENGDVQRITEDLMHGMQKSGDYFVSRSKVVDRLLGMVGSRLNLAEHSVLGLRDLSSSKTMTSGLVKVYKGSDDLFYLRNLRSVMPCEPPSSTPHLALTPRQQSIFWRRLRPELVKACKTPLSSDNLTLLNRTTSDAPQHLQNLVQCVHNCLHGVAPAFVKSLLVRTYHVPLSEGFGINLTQEMHKLGINMRHLGYMRNLIRRALPGKVSVFHGEKYIRTTHNLSIEVEEGGVLLIENKEVKVQSTKRNKIATTTLPIAKKYREDSISNATAFYGEIYHTQHTEEIRLILLAEMVARALKSCVRYQLRAHNESNQAVSMVFLRRLITDHLNFLTGAGAGAAVYCEEVLFEAVRERFGSCAVRLSERKGLLNILQPVLLYIVYRVKDMFAIQFTPVVLSAFSQSPIGFSFSLNDIIEVSPIIRHNLQAAYFADAMLLAAEADELKERSFRTEVLQDQPSIFYTLSERKGGRIAVNYGTLGAKFNAVIMKGCELEQQGPVKDDRFIRAICFHPMQKACVDCNHHESIVPVDLHAPFSVCIFFRCLGGKDMHRTLVDSGRYRFAIGRDNVLSFSFYESVHTINLRCSLIESTLWQHVIGTYDGTTLRVYLNTHLAFEVEVEPILIQKEAVLRLKHEDRMKEIQQDEVEERTRLKEKTISDATIFFQTKEGIATLKKLSARLVEVDGYKPEEKSETGEPLNGKQKRALVIKKAKEEYMQELFNKNKEELAVRFNQLRDDEMDQFHRMLQNGKFNVLRPLRIGGALPDASNREGSDYFFGNMSCVAIYPSCLSSDRIHRHFAASQRQVHVDSQRLYGKAASKFLPAFSAYYNQGLFDSDTETQFLTAYARSLCNSLFLDPEMRSKSDVDAAKVHLLNLLHIMKHRQLIDVVATLVKIIPRDAEFADIIVECILTLKELHKHYLSSSLILSRDYLAFLPFELGLIAPYRPYRFYEAAAFIFQEVARDYTYSFIYGQVDLSWLSELRSSLLAIAIVKNAFEDKQLKVVKVVELMSLSKVKDHPGLPSDSDVLVLVQNSPLLEGFDLHGCSMLTDSSLEYLNRINFIKVLDLTGCHHITDKGLSKLLNVIPKLERLSLADIPGLTDDGIQLVSKNCSQLIFLNLNGCHQVTVIPLLALCRNNPFLNNLQLSKVLLTDEGLADLANILQSMQVVELNISYCSAITDIGVAAIADSCPKIRRLNLAGVNRATFRSIQQITTRCWELSSLNIQDVFLINDKVFIYDPACDGRAAANENMLVAMKVIVLSECLALSDRGIGALAERCRGVENLGLKGCNKLTDKALEYLADEMLCASSKYAMAATFLTLDLSFCTQFTVSGLKPLLAKCQVLNDLDLSGLVTTVDDQCVKMVCCVCPTLQSLKIRQCLLLTDLAICYIADSLWLESLDISGCSRITDSGIEVLAGACSGLQYLHMNKLKLVSITSLKYVEQSCKGLRLLQCRDCPLVNFQDIDLSQWNVEVDR